MKRPLAVATLSTLLSASALCAETTPLPFTYEAFEAGVTHVDLAQCPEALAAEGRLNETFAACPPGLLNEYSERPPQLL